MKRAIVILFLLVSFCANSQKVQGLYEKKFLYLEYAFYQGKFDEVEAEGEKFVKKFQANHNGNRNYFQSMAILARAQYLNSDFAEYAQTIGLLKKEIDALNDSTKINGLEALAEVYINSNQSLKALDCIEKAEGLRSTELQKFDLSLLKSFALYQQGYYNNAFKLLELQEDYRLKMAASVQAVSNYYFKKLKNDFNARKTKYFLHQNLKAMILTAQQNYDRADALIVLNKDWAKKNVALNYPVYAQSFYTEGVCNEMKGDDRKAIISYSNAHSFGNYQENAPGKVQAIYKNALCNIRLGNSIETQNLLRKLQMYSSRYSGWKEPFQAWYELAMVNKLYYEGNYAAALTRLNEFKKYTNDVAGIHDMIVEYHKIFGMIVYGLGDIPSYLKNLEKFDQLVKENSGVEAPARGRVRLQKDIVLLKFFGLSDSLRNSISTDVSKVSHHLNPQGEDASRYFDLASDYYFQSGSIDSAIKYADMSRKISIIEIKRTGGLSLYHHLKYAYYLFSAGKVQEASRIIREKESDVLKLSVVDNPEYVKPLLLLNELYLLTGENEKSDILKSKLAGFSGQMGLHFDLIIKIETAYALAGIYKEISNYYQAGRFIDQALIDTKSKFSGTAFLLPVLMRSAQLNIIDGDYEQADKEISEALRIAEKAFGKNSFSYANIRKLQVEYFDAIADYNKALLASSEAWNIYEKVLGRENGMNISMLLLQTGISMKSSKISNEEVDVLYKRLLASALEIFSENSDVYMNIAIQKAEFFITISKYDEAALLLDKAHNFWKVNSDLNSGKLAKVLILKGKLYYGQKNYAKAEKQFEVAGKIFKDIFSENHPFYNRCKGDLAKVYYMQKDFEKSLDALEEIIPRYLQYVEKLFPTMSFRQKSQYWNNLKDEFEFYNFLVLSHFAGQKPKMIGSVYNNVISTKAILLSSDIKMREVIATSGDSLLVAKYEEWVSQKELLTSAYSMSKSQLLLQNISLELIEERIEQLEKFMSTRSELFAERKKESSIRWEDIRKVLNENESVVEMVRLRYFNHSFSDSAFYAAMIINKISTDNPELVLFPNAAGLESRSYKQYRNSIIYHLKDKDSYNHYWKPLVGKLKQQIYFSPDGIYYQINPETFKTEEGKFLSEEYSISYLTNSKDIMNGFESFINKKKKKEIYVSDRFVLGGNPEYYTSKKEGASIVQLPGAEMEVKELASMLSSKGRKNELIVGKYLTEDTIKSITNVKVLHIATHGFFKENKTEEESNSSSDQLLNSGILLAGAGEIIDNNENSNASPGILTAYEASCLNLTNTEIVVLSACETGRGDVKNGEGVFGLQRAFLLAGSDAVIVSLFKVNDEVTKKFMSYFYDQWLSTGNKREAFKFARLKIKEQFPEPLDWGAFVMVESKPKAFTVGLIK